MEFNIGDKVRCDSGYFGNYKTVGKLGRVLHYVPLLNTYIVEFDEWIGGNDGQGKGRHGHCWSFPASCLSLVENNEVKLTNEELEEWKKTTDFEEYYRCRAIDKFLKEEEVK